MDVVRQDPPLRMKKKDGRRSGPNNSRVEAKSLNTKKNWTIFIGRKTLKLSKSALLYGRKGLTRWKKTAAKEWKPKKQQELR